MLVVGRCPLHGQPVTHLNQNGTTSGFQSDFILPAHALEHSRASCLLAFVSLTRFLVSASLTWSRVFVRLTRSLASASLKMYRAFVSLTRSLVSASLTRSRVFVA